MEIKMSEQEEKKTIEIVISYTKETGSVTVSGPLEDRLICFGLLEMAKEVVKDFKVTQ